MNVSTLIYFDLLQLFLPVAELSGGTLPGVSVEDARAGSSGCNQTPGAMLWGFRDLSLSIVGVRS